MKGQPKKGEGRENHLSDASFFNVVQGRSHLVCPGGSLSPAGTGRGGGFCRIGKGKHPADRRGGHSRHGGGTDHRRSPPLETARGSSAFLRLVERSPAGGDMGFHFHAAGTLSPSPDEEIRPRRMAFFGKNQLDPNCGLDRPGNPVILGAGGGLVIGGLIDSALGRCSQIFRVLGDPRQRGKRNRE